ncbi:N-acetylmuramoyl-L-alanine amidase family protein [Hyalangium rubrum]|uniref:N-acetylmuramoyl-L-alanine amidase n=1 Tax=Hyalangium rubrum TaxID=3103134 RepID=A0ABU5H324_9BACT|nr:N-acetylmuramoyl-L-alanine amidase [Hyalangium sp. s54d21]MDY7227867.1 N-acetylmuramoyl-L-alanine amidase [Hyalangium sp. s54d21]
MRRIVGTLLGLVLVTGFSERAYAQPAPSAPPEPSKVWPALGAPLTVQPLSVPKGFRKKRIYLDPGHGFRGNTGNSSVTCENEADFTLRVTEDLARRLEATGRFQIRLSRKAGKDVSYPDRVAEAERWGADVFVSLHSDSRGEATWWEPTPGQSCLRQDTGPGYSVLWADDTAEPLKTRRVTLARALSRRMTEAGFPPYDGADYVGLYDGDTQPGVFVSRHEPGRRIHVLRRPRIPSVIIETHHALDFEEAARWKEERTLEAFGAAVAQGLVDALSTPRSSAPSTSTGVTASK